MHLNLLQTAQANHSRLSCVFVMVHIKFDAQILQSVCYLLNLEVRPSINTFFWALELVLKRCSCVSRESKRGALGLPLNTPRSHTVGAVPVCLCGSLYVLYPYIYPLAVSMLLHEISSHRLHTETL